MEVLWDLLYDGKDGEEVVNVMLTMPDLNVNAKFKVSMLIFVLLVDTHFIYSFKNCMFTQTER